MHLSIFVVVTTHSSKGVFPLSTYLGFCVHNPDLRGVQWNLGTQVVGLLLYRTVPGEPVRPLMEMEGTLQGRSEGRNDVHPKRFNQILHYDWLLIKLFS